jgi:biopolymer transport protein TolR
MSFSSTKNKNGKKKHIISDINITPFVDVLLVLLIIFMVAAPMMTSNVEVNLPKGGGEVDNDKILPIAISVKSSGEIFIGEEVIKISQLVEKLTIITDKNFSHKVQIRADKNIDYGRVMDVVKMINLAGFNQVALATEI